MNFFGKIKTVINMPKGNIWLFLEALYTSAFVRFTLSFLPYSIVKKWLGKTNVVPDPELTPNEVKQINRIYHTLKLCDRYAIWKTECYTLALTGKIMLRRRKIASTLYIGWRKEKDKYEGHAWLKTPDGRVISGNIGISQFAVNAFFS